MYALDFFNLIQFSFTSNSQMYQISYQMKGFHSQIPKMYSLCIKMYKFCIKICMYVMESFNFIHFSLTSKCRIDLKF